jgi:glycosyltransferase involved in cell wall biosynthesis
VVVSHTYVEPENRGKLRALAERGPVTAVVPRRWRERALRREWRMDAESVEDDLRLVPARWFGRTQPSRGLMLLPRDLARDAVLQIEEEPWTPTAYFACRAPAAARIIFTWENIARRHLPPWSWMRRRVLASVDGVIAGSRGAAEVARAMGYSGPLAVIPQLGVTPPAEVPARTPAARTRFGFVGRLVREKGVDLLLRALALVDQPWDLVVVGDGPAHTELVALATELGLGERVLFAGARPHGEVASFWASIHVLVLPSRTTPRWREQLGHVLLEAMAQGVAVVGSNSGAIPEVIADAGRVFPEDDHAALAAVLRGLAGDAAAISSLGDAGRRRVLAEYTNQRIAERTREFHGEVMARR